MTGHHWMLRGALQDSWFITFEHAEAAARQHLKMHPLARMQIFKVVAIVRANEVTATTERISDDDTT